MDRTTAKEVIAFIKNPRVGYEYDRIEGVRLSFQLDNEYNGMSSSQSIWDIDQIVQILTEYRVSDVSKLEGKPCWILTDGYEALWSRSCVPHNNTYKHKEEMRKFEEEREARNKC